jgi:hypothetical protein
MRTCHGMPYARPNHRTETAMDWNPGELLKLSGGYWKTCALHAAVRLDVFTAVGARSLSADEIAGELGGDGRGVEMLLNALAAMELLEKSGGQYRNTEPSSRFLSKASPSYLGYLIMHHHFLYESWGKVHEAVLGGGPVRDSSSRADPARREAFLMGMFNSATNVAPLIVPQLDLAGRRHLLDLGGGPGTYAIHMCRANPGLRGTVLDLPTTETFAKRTIESFGLTERISFRAGDYFSEELGGPYDAAWLSHILHAAGPDGCRTIIDKTVAALEPGGVVMIHEFILDDSMDGPLFPALFSLNMLLGTEGGQSYSEGQLKGMLSDAGLKDIERVPLSLPNDSGVLVGLKSFPTK